MMYSKIDYDQRVGIYTIGVICSLVFLLPVFSDDAELKKIFLLLSAIFFSLTNLYYFINKYNDKKIKEYENKRANELKSSYQLIKIPVHLGSVYLKTSQAQTRQILTGALTYAQPKEYSLHIDCTNISDKTVTAVEIEIRMFNAFNEEVSSFTVSTGKQLLFGKTTQCSWDLTGTFDVKNAATEVKRVMFSDGTTWNK